jgi:hypothetical protein
MLDMIDATNTNVMNTTESLSADFPPEARWIRNMI